MFLRKPARELEPLPIAMSGVRMGERALQIGLDNPALAGAIAAKVGLSGTAAIVVTTDAAGEWETIPLAEISARANYRPARRAA